MMLWLEAPDGTEVCDPASTATHLRDGDEMPIRIHMSSWSRFRALALRTWPQGRKDALTIRLWSLGTN